MPVLHYLSLVVLWLGVCSVAYTAVYKWTDKEGHVQYSQMPPPVSQDVQPTLRSNSQFGVSSIKPLRSGDNIFCGSLAIMNVKLDDATLEENIHASIDKWTSDRDALDERRLHLPTTTSVSARRQLDTQYAEFDCRVNWAHGQLEILNSFERKSNNRYQALKSEYERLKTRQDEECSTDAKKLGKSMLVGKEANDWGKCYNHYRYKMRDVKAQMKENRRSLRESYE